MTIEIKENKFKDFFNLPSKIYVDHYVSPARSDLKRFLNKKNPTFAGKDNFRIYTAYIDGKCVGRITAQIHDKYNIHYKSKTGFFGFFDCINNTEVAKALIDTADTWLKSRGMQEMIGNFNLTTQQPMGVVVEGFENKPYMEMMYNPKYTPELLKENGLEPFFPTSTFEISLEHLNKDKLITDKVKALYANPDYEFKKVNKKDFKEQMKFCCHLLNVGFANNPLFVPISDDEFWFQAKEMTFILDEDITRFILHKGKPVGVIVNVPDINPVLKKYGSKLGIRMILDLLRLKKKPDRALLVFASIDPDFHAQGLASSMFNICLSDLVAKGYKSIGVTWVSDSNQGSLTALKRLNPKILQKLNLFKKSI